jgi:hypothetical protein
MALLLAPKIVFAIDSTWVCKPALAYEVNLESLLGGRLCHSSQQGQQFADKKK